MLGTRVLRSSLAIAKWACCERQELCRAVAQSTSASIRYLSTKDEPFDAEATLRAFQMLSDPEEELIRDVYFSKTGEEVLTVEADAHMKEDFDWAEFERRLGLDTISDEDVDEGWEQLQKKYEVQTEMIDEKNPNSRRKVVNDRSKEESVIIPPKEVESEFASLQHATEVENLEKPRYTFNDPEAFALPKNKKRPGYERRMMMKESEMEKIVFEFLCDQHFEWYKRGGDVDRVALSSNGQDLTVFYTIEHDGSERAAKWWEKWHKQKSRCCGEIRKRLSQRLISKYVPKVHMRLAKEPDTLDSEKGAVKEVDLLFERIAAEQQREQRRKAQLEPE